MEPSRRGRMIYGWSPSIGDPEPLGWFTVAAYLATAALCWRVGRSGCGLPTGDRRFWLLLAGAMVALGINKQLDLQSLLTVLARHAAQTGGWYEYRRAVQLIFITVATTGGIGIALGMAWRLRRRGSSTRMAGAGCVMLMTFVIVRAGSFHHIDVLLASGISGVRLNHVLELGGIAIIAVAAMTG